MPAPLPQQVWGKIWKDLVLLEPPAPMQKLTRPGDEAAQGKESLALRGLENTRVRGCAGRCAHGWWCM